MRKYSKIHEHMTSEDRPPRGVPLSEVSLPFCASVQAFSKKCGIFRALRCVLIGLAGLIRWCLRYQKMLIVFDSARWHKNSDYSKKALKLMRKYAKIHEHMTWRRNIVLAGSTACFVRATRVIVIWEQRGEQVKYSDKIVYKPTNMTLFARFFNPNWE